MFKTIKLKFVLFSLLWVVNLLILGFLGVFQTFDLLSGLHQVSHIEIPANKNVILFDMLHDGMRSVVMESHYALTQNDMASVQELNQEAKKISQNMREYYNNLLELQLVDEVKNELASLKNPMEDYLDVGFLLTEIALKKNMAEFINNIPKFNEKFKILEEKNEKIAKMIETSAKAKFSSSESIFTTFVVAALATILIGFLFSFIIIRDIQKSLKNILLKIMQSAHFVLNSSGEFSKTSDVLAHGTQRSSVNLTEVSASIGQMAKTTTDTSHDIQRVSDSIRNVHSISIECNDKMKVLQSSMQDILHFNQNIKDLVKIIEEISVKTEVINEIVFQTKILSFNASVEAERAGEHGRGFSVVAQEVSNLAQMSGKAALEIAQIVKSSIRSAEGISTENLEKVKTGNEYVMQVAGYLNQIKSSAESAAKDSLRIKTASEQQALGINEIKYALAGIDEVTQNTNQTALQTSHGATELEKHSSILNDAVLELATLIDSPRKIVSV